MRKWSVWLLLLALVVTMTPGSLAEESFRVAGYDDESTDHVWTENLFFERMEERTGVKLQLEQYATSGAWQSAKAAMLDGSAQLPDALFKANLTTQETQAFYEAGKLIDLRPLLQENAPNLWKLLEDHPDWLQAITLPDGAIVALPFIDEMQFTNAIWVNQHWLTREGLEMPTTAEELTALLRYFRDHDMNDNGKKKDEVPLTFSSMWDLRFLQHAFGVNANDYYITMDENGQVSEVLTSQANRDYLAWLNELWEEGLLDSSGFTGLRAASGRTDEKAEVVYGVIISSSPANMVHVSKVDQYALMAPLYYDGQQVYRDLTGDVVRGAFAITSACEDPAALLRWVDYLYTEEGYILAASGEEGKEFYRNSDDGTWNWEDTAETLVNITLPAATIYDDLAAMPGRAAVEFQLQLDDEKTVAIMQDIRRLREIDALPYPMVWLTEAQQTRVNELIYAIGSYAEQQMVWFVVGDVPLNDKTWQTFCDTVKSLGVDEMVAIWQSAADALQ